MATTVSAYIGAYATGRALKRAAQNRTRLSSPGAASPLPCFFRFRFRRYAGGSRSRFKKVLPPRPESTVPAIGHAEGLLEAAPGWAARRIIPCRLISESCSRRASSAILSGCRRMFRNECSRRSEYWEPPRLARRPASRGSRAKCGPVAPEVWPYGFVSTSRAATCPLRVRHRKEIYRIEVCTGCPLVVRGANDARCPMRRGAGVSPAMPVIPAALPVERRHGRRRGKPKRSLHGSAALH